jgi:hypothetical protein
MQDKETTVRSRELADALHEAMAGAELNANIMAHRLGWSQSKVSRLVNGKRSGSPVDVSAFLALCEVIGPERDRLISLSEDMMEPGWWQRFDERLPKQLRTLIGHEDKAVSLGQFQPTMIPGLLQTADYARALIVGNGNVPVDELDERITIRMNRKSLFNRQDSPQFTFYLHEFVLRLPVGGSEVMSEQLHELLRMSVRRNVSIRVVPAAIGAHGAIAGGFIMFEFANFNPVIYLDSETSCLFLEKRAEAKAYKRILSDLASIALDEQESREVITSLAIELSGERDEQPRTGDCLADQ